MRPAKRPSDEEGVKTEIKTEDEAAVPEKKPKIVVPQPKKNVLKWRTRRYVTRPDPVDDPSRFVQGYLKEAVSSQREQLEYRGEFARCDTALFVAPLSSLQLPYVCDFHLPTFEDKFKHGGTKSSRVYLEKTRGVDLMPGLTDRVISYINEHIATGENHRIADTMLSDLATGYRRDVIERDNLYHIYALWLYSHVTTFHIILEELFLFIVTGERSDNSSGVFITANHIRTLCSLIAAEATYGSPTRIATFESCIRSYALDLSNVIADLYLAATEQHLTGTFVRPLLPSARTGHGHDTALKGIIVKFYGLSALARPWHAQI